MGAQSSKKTRLVKEQEEEKKIVAKPAETETKTEKKQDKKETKTTSGRSCKVYPIGRNDPEKLQKLKKLRSYCDHDNDEIWPEGYACTRMLHMLPKTDVLYVGFDRENHKVCGFVHVFDYGNAIELESIASRSAKDTQYKGNMVALFDAITTDARSQGKVFAEIKDFTAEGAKFYFRYGFKMVGSTQQLILPLQGRIPTVQELRDMEIAEWEKGGRKNKLYYTKESDNLERWREQYGSYNLFSAERMGKDPADVALIWHDFSDVKLFPDAMYTTQEEREAYLRAAEEEDRRQGLIETPETPAED